MAFDLVEFQAVRLGKSVNQLIIENGQNKLEINLCQFTRKTKKTHSRKYERTY